MHTGGKCPREVGVVGEGRVSEQQVLIRGNLGSGKAKGLVVEQNGGPRQTSSHE